MFVGNQKRLPMNVQGALALFFTAAGLKLLFSR